MTSRQVLQGKARSKQPVGFELHTMAPSAQENSPHKTSAYTHKFVQKYDVCGRMTFAQHGRRGFGSPLRTAKYYHRSHQSHYSSEPSIRHIPTRSAINMFMELLLLRWNVVFLALEVEGVPNAVNNLTSLCCKNLRGT